MIIKDKIESINKINELKLNKFPEQIFKSNEENKVEEFKKKILQIIMQLEINLKQEVFLN